MTDYRFQDIWKEQCDAARGVRDRFGVVEALDYLVGEKLMTYAETAATRPEFARELPRFVAEIRSIFRAEEIQLYLDDLERMRAREQQALSAEPLDDDWMFETPEQRAAASERLSRLKEFLTSTVLGTA
jgi:hypothetical protein